MATLGKWSGGSVAILPTTTWAAPASLFPTQDRNDSSTYTFTASTSTLTLPSSGLADGYLIVGAFEFEDTSNGRNNPQGRFIQASGTGNFVSGSSSGFNRDNSEDRSFVRTWAFVDAPSASSTYQFQWRRDSDAPTGGTVRSEFQVIPLYYSNHGIYSSASTTCTGGTTPTQITGFTAVDESDTAAIEIASNVITLKGDNKRYLALGSSYWQGIGNARTQRWQGFRVDGTMDDTAKGYSYARNSANADIGEMFTTIIDRATTDITVDQFVYRGPAVGTFPNAGGDVDGNTTGSNPNHVTVILELNDDAEVFRSHSTTQQDIDVAGTRVDLQIADTVDFNDSASFTKTSATEIDSVQAGDILLGANISGGYASTSTARYTGYSELTINGTGQSDTAAGDYGRGNQSTQDCWGWSANLMSFVATSASDELGVSAGKITGGEAGTVDTLAGWVGFWGVNLDTLEASGGGGGDDLTADDVVISTEVSSPALSESHALTADDVSIDTVVPSTGGGGITVHATQSGGITTGTGTDSISLPAGMEEGDWVGIFVIGLGGAPTVTSSPSGWTEDYWSTSIEYQGLIRKKMGATPDTSVSLPQADSGGGDTYSAVYSIIVIRGADGTTPMDATIVGPTEVNNTPLNTASITTATDGAFVQTVGAEFKIGAYSFTSAPTGYSNAENTSISAFGGAAIIASVSSTKEVATAGAEDPGAYNSNLTTSDTAIGFTVAWRPAAGGGAGDAPVLTEVVSEDDDLLADDLEIDTVVSSPTIGQEHDLTSTDISIDTLVDTPSVGQEHNLTSTDISNDVTVSNPVLGQSAVLNANDIELDTEVTNPTIGQVHNLNATDVSSDTETTSPSLGQIHDLTNQEVAIEQEVSSPSVGQIHDLNSDDVELNTTVDNPSLGTGHNLNATDVELDVNVTQPSISQEHNLNIDDVELDTIVSTPNLSIEHNLSANDISIETVTSSPSVGQEHSLNAQSVEADTEVTNPNLLAAAGITNLLADDISLSTEVTSSSLGQIHELNSDSVEIDTVIDSPSLGVVYGFSADDINLDVSIDTPAIGQSHDLNGDDVSLDMVVSEPNVTSVAGLDSLLADDISLDTGVSTPSISEINDLSAEDVEITVNVSSPSVSEVSVLTADDVQIDTVVSQPSITELSSLNADSVEIDTVVSTPSLTQIYNFNAVSPSIDTSVVEVSLGQVHPLLADDISLDVTMTNGNVIVLPFVKVNPLIKDNLRGYEDADQGVLDNSVTMMNKKDLRGYDVNDQGTLDNSTSGNPQYKNLRG